MKKVIIFSMIFLGLPVLFVYAQDGTSAPTDTQAEVAPREVATSTPRSTEALVATSTRPITIPPPAPTPTPKPAIAIEPSPAPEVIVQDVAKNSGLPLIPTILGVLTLAFVGYAAYALNAKKKSPNKQDDQKDKSNCLNFKKLLDKKLEEITNFRGQLESKLKEVGREKIRETLTGTPEGKLLELIEAGEKKYARLKGLFEQCTLELEGDKFRGIIIENSLINKNILDKIDVKKTYQSGDWTLHNVLVGKEQIHELAKHIADGPWYIHLWKKGEDDVKVIFKNKVFDIKFSDKSTWTDAVTYGQSIGIPDDQLNFPIK